MNLRQDALLAASKLIIAVNETISSLPRNQVGTIGKISAFPGAYNVIPGKVVLGMEIRDLSSEKIELIFSKIERNAVNISNNTKTKINFLRQPSVAKPALTEKSLQQIINSTARSLRLTTKFMQSGAGHDSQNMSRIAPVAMIFVPSVGGYQPFTQRVYKKGGHDQWCKRSVAINFVSGQSSRITVFFYSWFKPNVAI